MPIQIEKYQQLIKELGNKITLVAVSKTRSPEDILALYKLGQRDFGENYTQEMVSKAEQLPRDIRWHFIGHLQTNKIKFILPFVHLVQGVDSLKLLKEINRQGNKINRITDVLLQVHIAQEETKFGLNEDELDEIINTELKESRELNNIRITGMMGMASLTGDKNQIRSEFAYLKTLFDKYSKPQSINYKPHTLSMGMSNDFNIAIGEGSTMVRIGSLIFGERS